MNCIFCNKLIQNKGSLAAHEKSCLQNPERIKHPRSPRAGTQKGSTPWNKGVKFSEENIQRSIDFFAESRYLSVNEAVARKHAKRVIIQKYGHMCQICHTSEWMGLPVPLVCDHISGDSTDNRLENFRVVCCNCDAQLPTYKSKNRGRGRSYDREHYQRKVNRTGAPDSP